MYSLKLPNGRIKITAKELSRSHVLENLQHKDYLHTLQTTKSSYATFRTIASHKHAVKTQEVNKLCLSAFDDKRYILPDGMSTLAPGHFRIAELNAKRKKIIIMIANVYVVFYGNQEGTTDTSSL